VIRWIRTQLLYWLHPVIMTVQSSNGLARRDIIVSGGKRFRITIILNSTTIVVRRTFTQWIRDEVLS
jgi:hypothetical protein